ncbi:MAG: hypothetical protein ACOH2E_01755 [Candidatus Paracaedibacter sp.]
MDRILFERLCSSFIKNSLLTGNTLPAMYVELLQLSLSVTQPTLFQAPFVNDWQALLTEKRQICSRELSTIASQQNFEFQNEGALYFHYCQFLGNMIPANLENLHNTSFFKQLKNPFMAVMNKELLVLKATLPGVGVSAPTWEKIFALEPVITIQQYQWAAFSHHQAGLNAADLGIGLANLTKAAEYYEKQLEAIKSARQTPTAADYVNIAAAYFHAGKFAESVNIKVENYTKAYAYIKVLLEIELNEGKIQQARAALEEINTYLSGYNKIASDKSVDEQQLDG